jgi:hypothetical protein
MQHGDGAVELHLRLRAARNWKVDLAEFFLCPSYAEAEQQCDGSEQEDFGFHNRPPFPILDLATSAQSRF